MVAYRLESLAVVVDDDKWMIRERKERKYEFIFCKKNEAKVILLV